MIKIFGPLSYTFLRIPYDIATEVGFLEASNMPNKDFIIRSLKTAMH